MSKVQVGTETMVGVVGVARTPLSPKGKVFIRGELWDAVSTASVDSGAEVRVRRVEGLVLDVEPAPTPARSAGSAGASS